MLVRGHTYVMPSIIAEVRDKLSFIVPFENFIYIGPRSARCLQRILLCSVLGVLTSEACCEMKCTREGMKPPSAVRGLKRSLERLRRSFCRASSSCQGVKSSGRDIFTTFFYLENLIGIS